MPRKKYTHSAGFNITSLKGLSGIYIFYGENNEILYVGSCDDKDEEKENWKKRYQSHNTYGGQKLTPDVKYMDVIIPNQDISHRHLLVLEYLLMWYLRPPKNLPKGLDTPWKYFHWRWDEETVIRVAKDKYNFDIRGTVSDFLSAFIYKRIQREWDENGDFRKYGENNSEIVKVFCSSKRNCSCLNCLAKKRHRKIWTTKRKPKNDSSLNI